MLGGCGSDGLAEGDTEGASDGNGVASGSEGPNNAHEKMIYKPYNDKHVVGSGIPVQTYQGSTD